MDVFKTNIYIYIYRFIRISQYMYSPVMVSFFLMSVGAPADWTLTYHDPEESV